MKIDLHAHSRYSKRPATWILKKINCAESYTEPEELYRIARERGMDAVTITDHNSIDGCLEIAHLPGVFTGCEITSYFPADGCKAHVLAYRMNEAQFREIDRLRENIFELVAYLIDQNLPHAIAHPFHAVNDRMSLEHFEEMVLLFRHFELSGDQDAGANRLLQEMLDALTPDDIAALAEKHGIEPRHAEPWRKGYLGGSDDHSALNIAQAYTEVAGATDIESFWAGAQACGSRPRWQRPGTPQTMAHSLYGVAYQMYQDKFALDRYQEYNLLMRFLDRMLQMRPRKSPGRMAQLYSKLKRARSAPSADSSMTEVVQYEAERIVNKDPQLRSVLDQGLSFCREPDQHWFRFVNQITNNMLGHVARHSVERVMGGNPFDIFHTLGSTGALYTLLAPYFVAYSLYSSHRRLAEKIRDGFQTRAAASGDGRPRVGHFTDTFEEINGVAHTLNMQMRLAQRSGKDLTMITCMNGSSRVPYAPGVRYFEPVDVLRLPEYEEQKIFIPPLLEILQFCYERNFTHIHSATPGPIGLAGLAISRILKVPFCTTYHTALPQYAGHLTDDPAIERLAWSATVWFYQQADVVYSLSEATTNELVEKGVPEDRIQRVPRGVDIERFRPDKKRKDIDLPNGGPRILYVGRVSKEKNLDVLARAFSLLVKKNGSAPPQLIVVGDGPYADEMRGMLKGLPVTFTGYIEGDDLDAIYASCDLFVFPSTTDTFGNVVLEAQASGLPVLVTDEGGPRENLLPGQTGEIVKGKDPEALEGALRHMITHPDRMKDMGHQAREYAEKRSYGRAFDQYWETYAASMADGARN